jgi:hypothetical protein
MQMPLRDRFYDAMSSVTEFGERISKEDLATFASGLLSYLTVLSDVESWAGVAAATVQFVTLLHTLFRRISSFTRTISLVASKLAELFGMAAESFRNLPGKLFGAISSRLSSKSEIAEAQAPIGEIHAFVKGINGMWRGTNSVIQRLRRVLAYTAACVMTEGGDLPFGDYRLYVAKKSKNAENDGVPVIMQVVEDITFFADRGYSAWKLGDPRVLLFGADDMVTLFELCRDVIDIWPYYQTRVLPKGEDPDGMDSAGKAFAASFKDKACWREQYELLVQKTSRAINDFRRTSVANTEKWGGTYTSQFLTEVFRKVDNIVESLVNFRITNKTRVKPWVVGIHGIPGIGKTMLSRIHLSEYHRRFGNGPIKDSHLYICSSADKYMSGFAGQPYMLLDDLSSTLPAKTQDAGALDTFLRCAGVEAYTAVMADVNDKGKWPVNTEALMVTTNVSHLYVGQFMSEPNAIWRRFDLYVEVRPGKGAVNAYGTLDINNPRVLEKLQFSARRTVMKIQDSTTNYVHSYAKIVETPSTARGVTVVWQSEPVWLSYFHYMHLVQWSLDHLEQDRTTGSKLDIFGSEDTCVHGRSYSCFECHRFRPTQSDVADTQAPPTPFSSVAADLGMGPPGWEPPEEDIGVPLEVESEPQLIEPTWYESYIEGPFRDLRQFIRRVTSGTYWSIVDLFQTSWAELPGNKIFQTIVAGCLMAGAFEWLRRTQRLTFSSRVERAAQENRELKGEIVQASTLLHESIAQTQMEFSTPRPELEPSRKKWDQQVLATPTLRATGVDEQWILRNHASSFAVFQGQSKTGGLGRITAICLHANLWVTNWHWVQDLTVVDGVYTISVVPDSGKLFNNIRFTAADIYVVPGRCDVAYILLRSLPPRRSMLPRIPEGFAAKLTVGTPIVGSLAITRDTGETILSQVSFTRDRGTAVKCYKGDLPIVGGPEDIGEIFRYERNDQERVAICGSALFAIYTQAGVRTAHLVGLHSWGHDRRVGFASAISKAEVLDALHWFAAQGQPVHADVAFPQSERIPKLVSQPHSRSNLNWNSLECTEYYGSLERPVHSNKSRVVHTPIYQLVEDVLGYKTEMYPPVMKGWRPYQAMHDTALLQAPSLDPIILRDARLDFQSGLMFDPHIVVPMSLQAAVQGAAGVAFVDSINMSTSMGFPINRPKKEFFTRLPNGDVVIPPEVIQDVEALTQRYLTLQRGDVFFQAHLKDEPVSEKKHLSGKTRVFTGCPVAF